MLKAVCPVFNLIFLMRP